MTDCDTSVRDTLYRLPCIETNFAETLAEVAWFGLGGGGYAIMRVTQPRQVCFLKSNESSSCLIHVSHIKQILGRDSVVFVTFLGLFIS